MNLKQLNFDNNSKVSDIQIYENNLIVSSYDNILRIYDKNTLEKSVKLPTPITKMCTFENYLFAISSTAGILYIFNKNYDLIDVISGYKNANIIFVFEDSIFITTLNKKCFKLLKTENNQNFISENECKMEYDVNDINILLNQPKLFASLKITDFEKIPTCYAYTDNKIAFGVENILKIYDVNFNETFTKIFDCCINCLTFYENGILVGFNDGKIHCENFFDSDETFIFNAHFDSYDNKKIYYPITSLFYDKFVFSSGGNGKIIKWDLKNKKQISKILDCEEYIRKFIINKNIIVVLMDDPMNDKKCKILCNFN